MKSFVICKPSSENVFRTMKAGRQRWVGHVTSMGMMRNAFSILVRKPKGKGHLERHRCNRRI